MENAVPTPPPKGAKQGQNGPTSRSIALALITPSQTQPRKLFDAQKLAELSDSLRKWGVLEPILVREVPGPDSSQFEIVAGERRFRAAKLAKLTEIPAIVRDLTDEQTLEIQVIENVQRDDLHPMEEAQGYGELVKRFKHSPADIAAKIGKSPSYIAQRMKLLDLAPTVRQMFLDDKLSASLALIIARIPVQALHVTAAKEITRDGGMTTAEARAHVMRAYMLDLKLATFDPADAGLVPKAGPCGTCPKRTGNQAALFADITKGDLCTDPGCYQQKQSEHGERQLAGARKAGQTIITGKDAKKLMPYGPHHVERHMARMSDKCYEDPKNRTVEQILGKDYKPALLVNPHNPAEIIPVVPVAALAAALKAQGIKRPVSVTSDAEKARTKAAKLENEVRRRLFDAIRGKVTGTVMELDDLRSIVAEVWSRWWSDHRRPIARLWSPDKDGEKRNDHDRSEAVEKLIPKMAAGELWQLLFDISLSSHLSIASYQTANADGPLYAAAKRHKVDAARIRAEVTAEQKPVKVPKAKPAAKSAKKSKAKP